ncbi:flavin reductase family protein [Alcaligenes endophyticus]|uniref:Flavin reductase family protein n=1 Tax=Alcaligenes endophyticus TaxID=1929088 RepID=A0ABT8EH17_9BURK|nr:flavin reductase family protein [Alcaligenes endophyticus]MCX5589763.1 flavin reductase family protein [Alcaligenes endophyticus]MDN4120574.1 flavin reductase family protein [Alcaligenes endophyticus]
MPVTVPHFDTAFFRSALGRFATGVTVVTAETADKQPVGLTVSSFNSVSLEPPLILWSLSKSSSSLPHIQASQGYVVHVLSAAQVKLARRFAYGSQTDRFTDQPLSRTPGGLLMLADECSAWFACRHYAQHDAGDHVVLIGAVEDCARTANLPLIYHAGDFDLTPNNLPLSQA